MCAYLDMYLPYGGNLRFGPIIGATYGSVYWQQAVHDIVSAYPLKLQPNPISKIFHQKLL